MQSSCNKRNRFCLLVFDSEIFSRTYLKGSSLLPAPLTEGLLLEFWFLFFFSQNHRYSTSHGGRLRTRRNNQVSWSRFPCKMKTGHWFSEFATRSLRKPLIFLFFTAFDSRHCGPGYEIIGDRRFPPYRREYNLVESIFKLHIRCEYFPLPRLAPSIQLISSLHTDASKPPVQLVYSESTYDYLDFAQNGRRISGVLLKHPYFTVGFIRI